MHMPSIQTYARAYAVFYMQMTFCGEATSTPSISLRSQGDCDPNIPSRPVPLPLNFVADVDGIKSKVCGEGEYLDWFECKPCEDGTFMTPKMAQEGKHSICQRCYETRMYEIVVEPCTKTRDAKIMCDEGYYRIEVPGKACQSECRRCDVCGVGSNMFKNFEVRACDEYKSTVCCHGADMVEVNGECILQTTTTILTATTTKDTSIPHPSHFFTEVTHSQTNESPSNKILKHNLTLFLMITLVRLTFISEFQLSF
ncbi:unnamed protein product [Lymnaea stagnalis]|uniref:TNFR-Cys domain-containing protein n=1 Tax=Lymnaea stagnalis TaxID=6523 RepID=A0AAV2HT08_LYMST